MTDTGQDNRIKLSDHFTTGRLLKFVYPSILMMIFTSIYSIVDGIFVSNIVGTTAFAAINLIMPFLMIVATLGFMIGTGGSAVVGITLGEGDKAGASRYFSMLTYWLIGVSVVIAAVCELILPWVIRALGADESMYGPCMIYGRISLVSLPFYMSQMAFQSFFPTAEKPRLGLYMTVMAGVTNMVLDALFIAVFHWGIAGAAAATAMSEVIGGSFPIIYFARKNDSLLSLGRTKFEGKILLKACTNGFSEMMTSIAGSVVAIVYNYQLMKFAAAAGVAAYGIVMYVNFIFISVFLGLSFGSAPIVSYHYGSGNEKELQNILRVVFKLISTLAIAMFLLSQVLAVPCTMIFASHDPALQTITVNGFRIFAFTFLLSGFNIFASSFFTALGNGLVSAFISFARTLVFEVFCVLVLPLLFGMNGIWMSAPCAEILASLLVAIFLIRKNKDYHYLTS